MAGVSLFYSYSHKDEQDRTELEKWLSTQRQKGRVQEWHDRKLRGGDPLQSTIDSRLREADVVLLLLSQDYLASEACQREMSFAISHRDTKRVVPIVLRQCAWKDTDCASIVALPTDAEPVNAWPRTDDAWADVFSGLERIINDMVSGFEPRAAFRQNLSKTEFLRKNIAASLEDLFVFPRITRDRDLKTPKRLESAEFLSLKDPALLIRGREYSGKSALLTWLYLELGTRSCHPLLVDGDLIFKTRNFEEMLEQTFQSQYVGDYQDWKLRSKRVALVDNYNHHISRNLLPYLCDMFEAVYVVVDDEEYLVYFKDELALAEFTVMTIRPMPLSDQEVLIRRWRGLSESRWDEESVDLSVDQLEERINSIITSHHIVPRYPFYVLSILQSLEAFMPRNLEITAYGHCYQALVTVQLVRKNIQPDEIDTCFNFLTESARAQFERADEGFSLRDYADFKQSYREKFFIQQSLIARIERDDYPVIVVSDDRVRFQYPYAYYYFLGRSLAASADEDTIERLCAALDKKENAYAIIFTVHHTQHRTLLESILAHSTATFEGILPALLTAEETGFMNDLVAQLPKSILSSRPVTENRREQRDLQPDGEDEGDETHKDADLAEIERGLRIIEILGQILRNRGGSFAKNDVLEILQSTFELGLRIINLFLGDLRKPEFEMWVSKNLDEAERDSESHDGKFDDRKRERYMQLLIQMMGYSVTFGMLSKISTAVSAEKLTDAIRSLVDQNPSPALEMIEFVVLLGQRGIDTGKLKSLLHEFRKVKNHWASRTLSWYVQDYLNTHRVEARQRHAVYGLLGLKYSPNK